MHPRTSGALAALALSLALVPTALALRATSEVSLLGRGTSGATAPSSAEPTSDRAALTADERADLAAYGLDEAATGELKRACRTRFDVYRDTPNFRNRSGIVAKDGICMGFSVLVRDIFERVRFEAAGERGNVLRALVASHALPVVKVRHTVGGASSLRAYSEGDPSFEDGMAKVMETAMLRNLHPSVFRGLIGSRLGIEDGAFTSAFFAERAARNQLSIAVYDKGLSGHVVLCYKVLLFEKVRLVYVYDCNQVYERTKDNHRITVLVYDRATNKLALRPDYAAWYGNKYDRIECAEPALPLLRDVLVRGLTQTLPHVVGDVAGAVKDGVQNLFGGLQSLAARGLGGIFVPKLRKAPEPGTTMAAD